MNEDEWMNGELLEHFYRFQEVVVAADGEAMG